MLCNASIRRQKNKQPFLDTFKMLKKKALFFNLFAFYAFFCAYNIFIKKINCPNYLIYNTNYKMVQNVYKN